MTEALDVLQRPRRAERQRRRVPVAVAREAEDPGLQGRRQGWVLAQERGEAALVRFYRAAAGGLPLAGGADGGVDAGLGARPRDPVLRRHHANADLTMVSFRGAKRTRILEVPGSMLRIAPE